MRLQKPSPNDFATSVRGAPFNAAAIATTTTAIAAKTKASGNHRSDQAAKRSANRARNPSAFLSRGTGPKLGVICRSLLFARFAYSERHEQYSDLEVGEPNWSRCAPVRSSRNGGLPADRRENCDGEIKKTAVAPTASTDKPQFDLPNRTLRLRSASSVSTSIRAASSSTRHSTRRAPARSIKAWRRDRL